MADDPDKPKKKKPKTKTQPVKGGSGSGSGKPPRKTAVGTGGGDEPPEFYPGESLACRVVRKFSPGVYVVTILKYALEAHLFTNHQYEPGAELIAQFYQWKCGILALRQAVPESEWLIPFPRETAKSKTTRKSRRSKDFGKKDKKYQLRRAYDLIMPPLEPDNKKVIHMADYEIDWLISDVESGMRTGCVKVDCEKTRSRGAILLYYGRVVGCLSGSKANPEPVPTEEALNTILKVMCESNTVVTLYDLPKEIVLSMSALFFGYPVKRDDEYNSLDYFDYILGWLENEKGTATIAISLSGGRGMCLAYVFEGEFAGAFFVNDQQFVAESQEFREFLQDESDSTLGVSLLPQEMTSSVVRFGFSLSHALNRLRDDDAS